MKRAMSLYFPYLATDRLSSPVGGSAPDDAARSGTTVVVATQASVMRVVGTDARATRAGIHIGMPLAEARALAPKNLIAQAHNPQDDRAALESLAIWADHLSPRVHLEGYDTLLLDMSGTQRLFPDEEALLRRAAGGIRQLGYTVRAALADTPGAARALAHAHPANLVIAPPGQTAALLAPLPVESLRIDHAIVATLQSLGAHTIEAVLHLPRSSLQSRFGAQLLYRLDQALGDQVELLIPFRPRTALKSSVNIGRSSQRYDILREALDRVLTSFCEQLERLVAGARQLFLTFHCPNQRPISLELNLSRATRSLSHLRSLLVARLDQLHLPSGAAGVVLWARRIEPLDAWQDELFDTGRRDVEELTELVDRLANRLGPRTVVRPRPASDHQPEYAFDYTASGDGGSEIVNSESRTKPARTPNENAAAPGSPFSILNSQFPPRPLRLLQNPIEVSVIATVPEGPPSCFIWKRSRELIVSCAGPERLETGWWRGRHIRRDYYRVSCESGRECWLFRQRESGRWFLHGWFD